MATYSALPATLNLVATVGNDFTLSLTVTENGSPWVATGATLATDIIDSSGTVVATDFTTAASTGSVTLSLTDTQTGTLGVGVYSYRLSVTKSSLTRDWIAGTLSIVEAGQGGSSTSSASLSISNSAVTLGITSLVAPLAENISVADAGGYYTGDTVEEALDELGAGLALYAENAPSSASASTYLDVSDPGLCSVNFAFSNQRIHLLRFGVGREITVNSVSVAADTTASASLTTGLVGIYAVGDDGQSWPLARSANDTALMGVTQTVTTKTFSSTGGWPSSVTLRPGRHYAVAVLFDGVTMPNTPAYPTLRTTMQSMHRARRSGPATSFLGNIPVADVGSTQVFWSRVVSGGTTNAARSAVLLGDSFFASYPTWIGLGNAQGGSRLHFIRNKGTGSETLAQMYARWSTDVAAYSPEWCVLHGGTNDIFSEGATSATITARYDSFIATAQAAGINLLICTPPTNSTATTNQKNTLTAVRSYLLALNETGVKVADTGITLTTGDGVTSDGALLVDTVHPNSSGLTALADAVDGVIATIT